MTAIDKLAYQLGIDVGTFKSDAGQIIAQINALGATAKQTFERDFGLRLAKAIDPKNYVSDLNKARSLLAQFGTDASVAFERSLGRQLSKQLMDSTKQARGFFSTLLSGTGTMSRFGTVASGVATGVLAAEVVKQLFVAGKAAVEFASQFQLALAQVKTIAEKGFDVEIIGDRIRRLSQQVPQDVLTLTRGLGDIIGSGVKESEKAMKILEISAKSAVAGLSSTAEASKAIVFVMNAFKEQNVDAQRVADVLFKTVDEGVVTFSELAANIGDVAAPAALAGASIEDVGAAIATMTKGGISAAETVTSIRRLLGEIVSPSKQAAEAAKAMGIELSRAGMQAAGGFSEFLKQIADITKKEPEKLRKLFPEERAMRAAGFLAGVAADEMQRLAKEYEKAGGISGSMEKAFQIVNQTADQQWKLFKNNLNSAVIDLGNAILSNLLPALQKMNDWFSDTSSIEKTIKALKEINPAADTAFLEMIAESEKSTEAVQVLQNRLDELSGKLDDIPATLMKYPGPVSIMLTMFDAVSSVLDKQIRQVIELSKTEEGRAKIEQMISEATMRANTATVKLIDAKAGLIKVNEEELAKQVEHESEFIKKASEILNLSKQINAERDRANQLIADARKKLSYDVPLPPSLQKHAEAQSQIYDLSKKTLDELKAMKETHAELLPLIEKEIEKREQASKRARETSEFMRDAKKQMEMLAASTDIEKKLVQIKQAAEEDRRRAEGSVEALSLASEIERKKINNLLQEALKAIPPMSAAYSSSFKEASSQAMQLLSSLREISEVMKRPGPLDEKAYKTFAAELKKLTEIKIKREVVATLPVNVQIPVRKLESSAFSEAIDRMRDALSEAGYPLKSFVLDLERFNLATEDELVDLAYMLDDRLGNVAESLMRFVNTVTSPGGTLLGGITAGIGLIGSVIGSFFGRGKKHEQEAMRLEDERRRAEEESARAAERYARALDKLREQMEEATVAELNEQFENLQSQIRDLFGATKNINREEAERILKLQDERQALMNAIEQAKDLGVSAEEIWLNWGMQLEKIEEILRMAGVDLEKLSVLDRKRLAELLDQYDIVSDAVKKFGMYAKNLSGLFDRLDLKFELFKIDDPIKQLDMLREAIEKEFGYILPKTEKDIAAFISAGYDALMAGGESLIKFLKEHNLEELTADEFVDLLRRLSEMTDAAFGSVAESIGDKFEEMIDKLELEFDLFDVEDPAKKLAMLREKLLKEFGALIPDTREGIDNLVREGLNAFLAGGETLRNYLKSINLEELTDEQFKDFLTMIESLADDMKSAVEEIEKEEKEIGVSAVKAITYQQGNRLIDEIATIRIVVTDMRRYVNELSKHSARISVALPDFADSFSSFSRKLLSLITSLSYQMPNLYALQNMIASSASRGDSSLVRKTPTNNFFLIKGANVTRLTESELATIDRALIDRAIASSRAVGVV